MCDVIGLKGGKRYDEDDIPETQVYIVIKEEDFNVNEYCPVDTDSENKEREYPPSLPVYNHIPIEEDAVNKMKILDLKEEFKKRGQPLLRNKGALV